MDIDWFAFHSGTRYLVLLAALATVLYAAIALASRRAVGRPGMVLVRVFGGLLDLQILLGVVTLITRAFFPALIGHLVMMVTAAVVLHVGIVRLKKQPDAERRPGTLLLFGALTLVLIIGGILAIQRPII